ncbi:MAG: serine hydrolase domain-containing protein [Planctomycetota bacterium]
MDAGWDEVQQRLPSVAAVFEQGLDEQHPGVQVYVSLDGTPIVDAALGQARPGVELSPDHLTLWMSAGKPLAAYLAARLVAAGRLYLSDRVEDLVPAFGSGGKEAITVRHLLTHTGGFRQVSSNWSPSPWAEVIERVCDAALEDDWIPGETAGYHVASGWYMLVEVCRIVSGVDATDAAISAMFERDVLGPLGMERSHVGMSRHRYIDYGVESAVSLDMSKTPASPLAFPNSEKGHVLCRPGGNARGPARSLGRFYEQLLRDRGDMPGDAILPGEIAREFTTRQRVGRRDETFKAQIDWCLGFLAADVEGRRIPYGYGPHASPDTFGHSGNRSSCAFADPAHRLVVVWVTTGLPSELLHQRRQHAVNAAIYEDLNLASG